MIVRQIVDPNLAQYAYLIACKRTREAVLIDPQRDIERYLDIAHSLNVRIAHVAETHIHADYLSAVSRLAAMDESVRLYLSAEGGIEWRYEWAESIPERVQFLHDGDTFNVGDLQIDVQHAPGHTPEHVIFLLSQPKVTAEPLAVITGDVLFVGDVGRPDLLESAVGQTGAAEQAARELFRTLQNLDSLPDHLQMWPGHGAGSACGKALGDLRQTTLGYERLTNPALQAVKHGEDAFLKYILKDQPEPPRYFARMKNANRSGPAPLFDIPEPSALKPEDLDGISGVGDPKEYGRPTVVDMRDRKSFYHGHIPGAILATLDKSFPTVTGSYIDPDEEIVLVGNASDIREAAINLIRVGLDKIVGYVTPEIMHEWAKGTDRLRMLKAIDFDELDGRRHYTNVLILDVRKKEEYDTRHIPEAVNISHVQLLNHEDELPRDKTILVHCAAGGRSSVASAYLHARGYCVACVDDSFGNWKERHLIPGVTSTSH